MDTQEGDIEKMLAEGILLVIEAINSDEKPTSPEQSESPIEIKADQMTILLLNGPRSISASAIT